MSERREARMALAIVALTSTAQLLLHLHELSSAAPPQNDHVLHLALSRAVSEAWRGAGSPLDPWVPYWGQGFPVLRYYQSLPHLLVGSLHALLGGRVALGQILLSVHLSCFTLAPLAFYWGGRMLGFDRLAAALSGACWALCAVDPGQRHFLGLQPSAFLWNGQGLFTQELALCVLPLALGAGHRALTTGRGLGGALWLMAGLWWCHLLIGYLACLLLLLPLVLPAADAALRVRARRLALFAGLLALGTAHLTLPTLLEAEWLTRSTFEPAAYWDSFGAETVMRALLSGGLLDGPRLPVLTLAALAGAVLAPRIGAGGRFVSAALAASLLLMFGRPTLDGLLALLPMSESLPLHRAICVVQWALLSCAGLALSMLARHIMAGGGGVRVLLGCLLLVGVLSPAWLATGERVAAARSMQEASAREHALHGDGVRAVLADFAELAAREPGRGYAGASWDWGNQFALGSVPIYHRWSSVGLPSVSYLYHTMGHASELEAYFDWLDPEHYALFGVRYAILPSAAHLQPFMRKRAEHPGLVSATIDGVQMFALVGVDGRVQLDPDAHRELLAYKRAFLDSDWHSHRRHVIIDLVPGAPMPAPRFPPTGEQWSAPRGRVLRSSGPVHDFEAHVQLQDPAYLMLRATMHPGLAAWVDGRPVRPQMLAPAFVGVPLQPGPHHVRVRYRPSPLKPALLLLALVVLVSVSLHERRRRRRG